MCHSRGALIPGTGVSAEVPESMGQVAEFTTSFTYLKPSKWLCNCKCVLLHI